MYRLFLSEKYIKESILHNKAIDFAANIVNFYEDFFEDRALIVELINFLKNN